MVEETLLQERWIRQLARALCRADADEARDIAQQARIALWRRPPRDGAKVRSWLGSVMRNLVRNQGRDRQTRQRALQQAPAPDPVPTPESLAARVQMHRRLGELVTALDEPFRQALLLRYYEGLSAADIARRLEIPAGTVRWRIKKALDTVRSALDQEHGGDRKRWLSLLAPLASPDADAGVPARAFPPKTLILAAAGGIVAATAINNVALDGQRRGATTAGSEVMARAESNAAASATRARRTARPPRSAALLAVVLPALAAAAEGETPLTAEEALAVCLEVKQQAVRCTGALVDSFVVNLPGAQRATYSARAAAEIVAEGTGPAPFREASCRKHIRYKTFTRSERTELSACATAADCAAFAACARPFFDKLIEPPKVTHDRAAEIAARTGFDGVPVTVDEQVLEALNRLVGTKDGRKRTREALERMREHEKVVGAALAAAGVPPELAAVGLIESGFDVSAASKSSVGLWQLTPGTAKNYGLTVDESLDERLDPSRSSAAAAALLRDLHREFRDWNLAIAAYNLGGGAVKRAIEQGATRDAAELRARGLLPAYQPGVMAAMLVLRDRTLLD